MKQLEKSRAVRKEVMMKDQFYTNNTQPLSITRRTFFKVSLAWAALFSMKDAILPDPIKAGDEPVPEEPANLDRNLEKY